MSSQILQILIQARQDTDAAFAQVLGNVKDLSESTSVWTEAQQQAAMAMSAAHDEAKKLNAELDKGKGSTDLLHDSVHHLHEALEGGLPHITSTAAGLLGITGAGIAAGAMAIHLADEFGEWGNQLENLKTKTALSIATLSTYNDTQRVTGVSAETLAMSMERLGAGIEAGTKPVRDAASTLGIPFEQLKAAKPEERLEMIRAAIGRLGPESDEAQAAMKGLFGRGGLGMLAALSEEAQGYQERVHAVVESIIGDEDEAAIAGKKWEESVNLVEVAFESLKLKAGFTVAQTANDIVTLSAAAAKFGESDSGPGKLNTWGTELLGWLNPVTLSIKITKAELDGLHEAASAFEDIPLPGAPKKAPKLAGDSAPSIDAPSEEAALALQKKMEESDKSLAEAEHALAEARAKGVTGLQGEIDKINAALQAKIQSLNASKLDADVRAHDIDLYKQAAAASIEAATRASELKLTTELATQAHKNHAEALKASGELTQIQGKLEAELAEAEAAGLSPLEASVQKLRDKADAEVVAATNAYTRIAKTGEATRADLENRDAAIAAANAIADLAEQHLRASAAAKEAAKDNAIEAKLYLEGNKDLQQSIDQLNDSRTTAIDKLVEETQRKMEAAEASLMQRVAEEGLTDATVSLSLAVQDYEQKLLLALGNQVHFEAHKQLTQSLGKAWTDVKSIMNDLGVSSDSTFGKIVAGVDKAISVANDMKNIFHDISSLIPAIGNMFGGVGSSASAATGGLLGMKSAIGGIGSALSALAGPALVFGGLVALLGGHKNATDDMQTEEGRQGISDYLKSHPGQAYDTTTDAPGYSPYLNQYGHDPGGHPTGSPNGGAAGGGSATTQIQTNSPPPQYADGTAYVPKTDYALLHEGEMVLPPPLAAFVRGAASATGSQPAMPSAPQARAASASQQPVVINLNVNLDGKLIDQRVIQSAKNGRITIHPGAVRST